MKTKVNERNMMNLMGKINTFFRKDVKEDKGIINKVVGWENKMTEYGLEIEVPIYEKERLMVSYSGNCHVHPMRVEMLKKKKEGQLYHLYKTNALLAISTPQSCDCIPICIGDTVEITGTKMTVKRNVYGNHYTRTFVQAPVSNTERANEIRANILDSLLWFCDDTMWIEIFEEDCSIVTRINREIHDILYSFVGKINFEIEIRRRAIPLALDDGLSAVY